MALDYGRTVYSWVCALADACDPHEFNRLLQLVDLAYGYESQATEQPTDFVAYVCATRVEDSTTAPVRVMTIHQAKGLQFDIIVLPELDVSLEGQPPPVVVGRPGPTQAITSVCRYVKKELQPFFPAHVQEMFRAHTTEVVNESLCLLYVALTRAIHALYLIVAPSKPTERTVPKTWADLVRSALCSGAQAVPETMLYEHGTPDWQPQLRQAATALSEMAARDSEEPELLTIQLRAPGARRTRGLERVRPSHVSTEPMVHLADRLRPRGAQARARVVLLHAWLEHSE
jgi:ATP-dependent exoDNAse (exonuclease V) beta subunit